MLAAQKHGGWGEQGMPQPSLQRPRTAGRQGMENAFLPRTRPHPPRLAPRAPPRRAGIAGLAQGTFQGYLSGLNTLGMVAGPLAWAQLYSAAARIGRPQLLYYAVAVLCAAQLVLARVAGGMGGVGVAGATGTGGKEVVGVARAGAPAPRKRAGAAGSARPVARPVS